MFNVYDNDDDLFFFFFNWMQMTMMMMIKMGMMMIMMIFSFLNGTMILIIFLPLFFLTRSRLPTQPKAPRLTSAIPCQALLASICPILDQAFVDGS